MADKPPDTGRRITMTQMTTVQQKFSSLTMEMTVLASNISARIFLMRIPFMNNLRISAQELGFVVFLLISSNVTALDFNPRFHNLGLEDGLSQASVSCIAQDPRGYMWFGTQDGLNRYDGYQFKVYRPDPGNPSSISNNSIWALFTDQSGVLWVGSYGGLNRYRQETDDFIRYQHDPANPYSLSHDNVRAIYQDHQGLLWVGTHGGGVNIFDTKSGHFTRYRHDPENPASLSHDVVNAIYVDSKGYVWIGTDAGLNRYDRGQNRFSRYSLGDKKPDHASSYEIIKTIYEDSRGVLWIGTYGQGMFAWHENRQRFVQYRHDPRNKNSLSDDRIMSFIEDDHGRIWIATDGGGMSIYTPSSDSFGQYAPKADDPYSVPSNRIYKLYQSANGVIWIGSYINGVGRYDRYSLGFNTFRNEELGEMEEIVHTRNFLEDNEGYLWIGTEGGGLIRQHRKTGEAKLFRHNARNSRSLASNRILKLYQDKQNIIWVGTADGWLHRYHAKTQHFARYQVESAFGEKLPHGNVRGIYEDSQGIFWVGTDAGGMHRFDRDKEQFIHYHHTDKEGSLSSNRVFNITEDHTGTLWIATFSGGLNRYDRGKDRFWHYRNDPANPHSIGFDHVLSVFEDSKKWLWITTDGGGFDRYDRETERFIHYRKEQGLISMTLYGILEDNRGYLWMSHNKGISRFDPESSRFWHYDVNDGIQGNEFYGGSYYKGRSGLLYFGGLDGYSVFNPDDINDNPHAPGVLIDGFQLFNRPVPVGEMEDGRRLLDKTIDTTDTLTLSYKDYVLSFEYVGLSYINTEKNQYAYRMEGLENDWNYVGSRRFATYTTLPPGKYVFRVKAANNSGIWNEKGAALNVVITPPFWRTWWFQGVALLVLLMLVVLVYRIRVRAIQERNLMLQGLVQERTTELRAKNEELEVQKDNLQKALQELSNTKDQLVEAAHRAGMADTATGVLHNVGNILNSVNTSASIIRETLLKPVLDKFIKANEVMKPHENNLLGFINQDPKGEKILRYYLQLEEPFKNERERLMNNTDRLVQKIEAINEAIAAQQRFAKGHAYNEKLNLADIIEEALLLQTGMLGRHDIKLQKKFADDMPMVTVQKTKLMQILVNLYKNAKEAMLEADTQEKVMTIEAYREDRRVYVKVSDTGVGIEKEHLEKVFAYGFTTKKTGHGFGLHSCANYMTEMGGKMWAESGGKNKGACFILSFPLKDDDISSERLKAANGGTY